MTVATREKCPCCDFDSDGFGKNIIGKGYGSMSDWIFAAAFLVLLGILILYMGSL